MSNKLPPALEPVLAKIRGMNSLGQSIWHEVVYHDGNQWCAYHPSKTFTDGEQVASWVTVEDRFFECADKGKTVQYYSGVCAGLAKERDQLQALYEQEKLDAGEVIMKLRAQLNAVENGPVYEPRDPADNYDDLRKQYNALRTYVACQAKTVKFYKERDYQAQREMMLASHQELNSQRDANEAMTNEIDQLRARVAELEQHIRDNCELTECCEPMAFNCCGEVVATSSSHILNRQPAQSLAAHNARVLRGLAEIADSGIPFEDGGEPYWYTLDGEWLRNRADRIEKEGE